MAMVETMAGSRDRERAPRAGAAAFRWVCLAVALGSAALVSACLPMGLVITSYASEGAAYLSTGKSLRDHALSGMMGEDCALLRLTEGEPVCIAEKGDPEQIIPELARTEDCRIWRVAPEGVVCVVRRDDPMPSLVATAECPAALNIDGRMVCVETEAARRRTGQPSAPVPEPGPAPSALAPYGIF